MARPTVVVIAVTISELSSARAKPPCSSPTMFSGVSRVGTMLHTDSGDR